MKIQNVDDAEVMKKITSNGLADSDNDELLLDKNVPSPQ